MFLSSPFRSGARLLIAATVFGLNVAGAAPSGVYAAPVVAVEPGLAPIHDELDPPDVLRVPTLAIGDVQSLEGNAGSRTARFPVTLSRASTREVRVFFDTANGSATGFNLLPGLLGADYQSRSGVLLFAPGTTARAVDVTVVGDQTHEPDETFFVRLRDAENAFILDAEGGGTIVNDDPLPSVSIDDFAATERNSGTNVSIPLTVRLTNPSSRDISIPFGTRDGTAVNGFCTTPGCRDYQAASGTLVLPAGRTSGTIRVTTFGDDVVESDETFFVTLGSPTNASLAVAEGRVTLVNDDQAPAPGPFAGSFQGTISGAQGSSAPLQLTLGQSGTTVTGTVDFGAGMLADLGAVCGLRAVPPSSIPLSGSTSQANPTRLVATTSFQEPDSGRTILVDVTADLSNNGSAFTADVQLTAGFPCAVAQLTAVATRS